MSIFFQPFFDGSQLATVMTSLVMLILLIMSIYGIRQLIFTINRLTGVQRHPYIDITVARWPMIVVLITAHSDEKMLARCIDSVLSTDYPLDRLKIIMSSDKSKGSAAKIIASYMTRFPGSISTFQQTDDQSEKSAALKSILLYAKADIAIMFDAKDVPSRGLLKQLVAPFFDPEIGAVMGRVVLVNSGVNLMTRLLDLEHSANYQIRQQAHMNLNLFPQYGGTVSGVRLSAVSAVGGWNNDALAEDRDMTLRLILNGWKTVYINRAECYEVVAEDWSERIKQGTRWIKENTQLMSRYWWPLARNPYMSLGQRMNALLSLCSFAMPLIVLIGWCLILGAYFLDAGLLLSPIVPIYVLMAFGMQSNSGAFFEMIVAVLLDGKRRRIRLLPFNFLGSGMSLLTPLASLCHSFLDGVLKRAQGWIKSRDLSRPVRK